MKLIVVAFALVAVAVAAPPATPSQVAQIVRSEFNQSPEGGYSFGYETEDGIKKQETGALVQVVDEENKPHEVVTVRGSFFYLDPEGNPQEIVYEADQNGYRAQGPSIPKRR